MPFIWTLRPAGGVLKATDDAHSTHLYRLYYIYNLWYRLTWSYTLTVLSEIIREVWIGISATTICFEVRRVLVGACF